MKPTFAVLGLGLALAACSQPAMQNSQAGAPAAAPPAATPAPIDVPAGDYKLDPLHSTVLFRADHLSFSKYVGRFDAPTQDHERIEHRIHRKQPGGAPFCLLLHGCVRRIHDKALDPLASLIQVRVLGAPQQMAGHAVYKALARAACRRRDRAYPE